MKKIVLTACLLTVVLAAVSFISSFTINSDTAHSADGKLAVYLVPHQDDETISMGADIVAHVNAKRPVVLVMVGDGTKSNARNVICQQTGICLTEEEFGEARNNEFKAAAEKLGVDVKNNVFFENLPEGKFTSKQADDLVDDYIRKYPNASFKTMSWLDLHPDHRKLGNSLNNRCVREIINDCRFLQSPLYQIGSPLATGDNAVVTPMSGKYYDTERVQAAINEYKYWNPSQKRYAIGFYSVGKQIDYTYKTHYSLWHANNSSWRNLTERNSAWDWLDRHPL